MDQRTEVAVATSPSAWQRALRAVFLLGGVVLFSWLMSATAHADGAVGPGHPVQTDESQGAGRGLGVSEAAPEEVSPLRGTDRLAAVLEKQVAKTGQQVRETTRPVTGAVTETLERTPVAPVTTAVTRTVGETVQKVVGTVRSTVGSTPVDPVLDVTEGVARDLSGAPAGDVVERESSTLVAEARPSVPKRSASGVRREKPVPDPERRAATPPPPALDALLPQVLDRPADARTDQPRPPAPTDPTGDPTDFAPPCAERGAASPSAPGTVADHATRAPGLPTAGDRVLTEPLLRFGGPAYTPACSPD